MKKLVVVLLIITASVALALTVIYQLAAPEIEARNVAKVAEAMNAVKGLNRVDYEPIEFDSAANPLVVNIWQDAESLSDKDMFPHYIVEVKPSGFGGEIDMMVGLTSVPRDSGVVVGISIVSMSETSGLGANASDPEWLAQFKTFYPPYSVTKDGGEIDAITGATITSRAICEGVNAAVKLHKHLMDIFLLES